MVSSIEDSLALIAMSIFKLISYSGGFRGGSGGLIEHPLCDQIIPFSWKFEKILVNIGKSMKMNP